MFFLRALYRQVINSERQRFDYLERHFTARSPGTRMHSIVCSLQSVTPTRNDSLQEQDSSFFSSAQCRWKPKTTTVLDVFVSHISVFYLDAWERKNISAAQTLSLRKDDASMKDFFCKYEKAGKRTDRFKRNGGALPEYWKFHVFRHTKNPKKKTANVLEGIGHHNFVQYWENY